MIAEKRAIPLVEIKEIVNQFCRSTREDEQALSRSNDLQAQIALIHSYLSERLPFIRVAREHMTIHRFGRLLARVAGPSQGAGRLGGKASGMVLAEHLLQGKRKENARIGGFRIPTSWLITSDALGDFINYNFLEDFRSFKFSRMEIQHNYPYLVQVCKQSVFSPEMQSQLRLILDDMGESARRSLPSSLLKNSTGTSFSGKYRSLFWQIPTKRGAPCRPLRSHRRGLRLDLQPGRHPVPSRRGLLDYYEEMGVLIQHVVGKRVGKYFFPAFAGVAFGNNEFRWSPRIRHKVGVVRIVAGLGTRAVDRVGNDYPMLVSPGQPGIRVNIMPRKSCAKSSSTSSTWKRGA